MRQDDAAGFEYAGRGRKSRIADGLKTLENNQTTSPLWFSDRNTVLGTF